MNGASILRLPDRAIIDVAGPDARAFLHRVLTQDVETLQAGALAYAALLTPQGRVLYDLFLFGEADRVRIDVATTARDALLQRLAAFRLRAAVDIIASDDAVHALWGLPSAMCDWRPDPRTARAGFRWAGAGAAPAHAAQEGSFEGYRTWRLDLALPEVVEDGLSDHVYATEANLDLLNGVDFRKGCFVGQETTSRMKRRNGIRSRILPLDFRDAAPPAATEVFAGELRAGEIVAAGGTRALARLRLDRIAGGLTADGAPAACSRPSWAPFDLLGEAPPRSPHLHEVGVPP